MLPHYCIRIPSRHCEILGFQLGSPVAPASISPVHSSCDVAKKRLQTGRHPKATSQALRSFFNGRLLMLARQVCGNTTSCEDDVRRAIGWDQCDARVRGARSGGVTDRRGPRPRPCSSSTTARAWNASDIICMLASVTVPPLKRFGWRGQGNGSTSLLSGVITTGHRAGCPFQSPSCQRVAGSSRPEWWLSPQWLKMAAPPTYTVTMTTVADTGTVAMVAYGQSATGFTYSSPVHFLVW